MEQLQTAVNNVLRPGDPVYFSGGVMWRAIITSPFIAGAAGVTYNYQGGAPVSVYDRTELNPNVDMFIFVSGANSVIDSLNFRQTEASWRRGRYG